MKLLIKCNAGVISLFAVLFVFTTMPVHADNKYSKKKVLRALTKVVK